MTIKNSYIQKSFEFDKELLKIPLHECGEKMVNFVLLSQKEKLKVVFGDETNPFFYLRNSVANALLVAIVNLNKEGFIVKIESMYRSMAQQKEKFTKRVQTVKTQYPDKSIPEIKKIANIYTAGISILAAHTAGAAVDVVLMNEDQKIINMGSNYPQGVSESYTEYPHLTEKVKSLRKTLCNAMANEGLVNYPFEWWHFSMGDVCAAYLKGQKIAIYGPLEFNIKTGKTEYLVTDKCYEFFD